MKNLVRDFVVEEIFERGCAFEPAFTDVGQALEAVRGKLTRDEFFALESAVSDAVNLATERAFVLGIEAMRNPAAWLLQPPNSDGNGK